jgi:tetratricopeptide (TPR) repeat protein
MIRHLGWTLTALILMSSGVGVGRAAQSIQDLRVRAETAIREGRSSEAVALLEKVSQDDTADSMTRLVYVVALIADGRVDAAEGQIARIQTDRMATPTQLGVLKASLARIKAAQATSRQIAPLIQRGEVRGGLEALDASPTTNEPGPVFARAYLLRLLGEFDAAIEVLRRAERGSADASPLRFARAAASVEEQQAAFAMAKEAFERGAFEGFPFLRSQKAAVVARAELAGTLRTPVRIRNAFASSLRARVARRRRLMRSLLFQH